MPRSLSSASLNAENHLLIKQFLPLIDPENCLNQTEVFSCNPLLVSKYNRLKQT